MTEEIIMFCKAFAAFAAVVALGAGLAVSSYITKIDTGMTVKDVTDLLDGG